MFRFRCVLMSALLIGASAPLTPSIDAAIPPVPAGVTVTNFVPALVSAPSHNYFLGLHGLSGWTYALGGRVGEVAMTSQPIAVPLAWNEFVPSWNATLPSDATLDVQARVIYEAMGTEPAHTTKYYDMGHWSGDSTKHPHGSVKNQVDADGDVDTDTLVLARQGGQLQLRLTFGRDDAATGQSSAADLPKLVRFVGLSFLDNTVKAEPQKPNHTAWGKTVPVPERFQMDFKDIGGNVWCSPTSVSMILAHWSNVTKRPELTLTVPQTAAAVLDPNWPGTGNWAFNTSFAGSFPGMRGYVTRLDDLNEVENWIEAGMPVALSVDYGLLRGKAKSSGHLVVCVGFTATGDVILADPGQHTEPGQKYRVFPRKDAVAGWGDSHNTVYLIYPETMTPPTSTAHHWEQ